MASATLSATANTIIASTGSWIAVGLRVGMVIRATAGLVGGNLNRNLRIVGLTATVITVAETQVVEAGPIATWGLAVGKSLIQGTTRRAFTFEEREIDIDGSELFTGCRIGSLQLQMQPNGMGTVTFGLVGRDMETRTGAGSPYFTNAVTPTTTLGLTAVEAQILLAGAPIVDLTSVNLSIDLSAQGTGVVGSVLTPDVFDNLAKVTGSISALRQDLDKVQDFLNEAQLSLSLVFVENESDPQSYINFFVGNLTFGSATKSELGQDGPRTQSFDLLIGKDERGGAYAPTMVLFQTDAA
jgi:hypothetical protein